MKDSNLGKVREDLKASAQVNLLKKGTPVRTVSTEGVVKGMKVSDDGETLQYLVEYLDHATGETSERYFRPDQLTVGE